MASEDAGYLRIFLRQSMNIRMFATVVRFRQDCVCTYTLFYRLNVLKNLNRLYTHKGACSVIHSSMCNVAIVAFVYAVPSIFAEWCVSGGMEAR